MWRAVAVFNTATALAFPALRAAAFATRSQQTYFPISDAAARYAFAPYHPTTRLLAEKRLRDLAPLGDHFFWRNAITTSTLKRPERINPQSSQ